MDIKKLFGLIVIGFLVVSILAACGQDTKDVTVSDSEAEMAEVEEQDGTSKQEETAKEEKTESKLGSRTNPVPYQKTATVEDVLYNDNGDEFAIKFDLSVLEVIRGDEAYQMLKKMNQFNEEAPEGYEWVLAKTKVKFTESETEDLAFFIDGTMNFSMVSESGDIYSGDVYSTTEPDFSFEMYVGSEKEGYIANLVKTGEKAQLRYEEFLGGQVFFDLQ